MDFYGLEAGDFRRRQEITYMKKQNWISLALIVICIGVLFGYRAFARIRADHTPPEIHMEEALLELSALEPRSALLQGVSARDKRDGDVSASLVVESVRLLRSDGTVTVTYAAFDAAGNVAKRSREVRFSDYRSPRFSLSDPLMFSQTSSYDVLSIVGAEDMLDGNISHRIRATVLDEVESGYTGTHDVQFRVTNSLGETVELILPVEIYTPSIFEGTLTLTDYLIYMKQGERFNSRTYLDTLTIGREEIMLNGSVPAGIRLEVSGGVNTGIPGVYTVDYQITREMGSQTYSAYSRLIVVVEG